MPTIKPRRTTVVLFQGDDYDRIEHLAHEVESAAQTSARVSRLGDDDQTEVRARAAEYDALVAEAVERGETVTVEAIRRTPYRELVVAHPPRPDNEADKAWGFNHDEMSGDLVPMCLPLVVDGEVQFESEAARAEFLDSLSDGDFSRVYSAAIKVNQGGAPDPLVSLASRLGAPTSVAISEQPSRLG